MGAIFIFDRIGNQWVQTARLFPSDGIEDETLGFNMALSEDGNTVVAGEAVYNGTFRNQGAVYVFHRVKGTWIQEAELLSPTPAREDFFGTWGVAISGDTLFAGDLGGNTLTPGVDVFTRLNGHWQLSTSIQLPNDPDFGVFTIAARNSTLAVGSPSGGFGSGIMFVFGLVNGNWALQAKLLAADPFPSAAFGSVVAVNGSSVIVGAPQGPGASAFAGTVYVFGKQERGWRQIARLVAADGFAGNGFGGSVDMDGGILAVAASRRANATGENAGAVYLYQLKDGTWSP